MTIAGVKVGRNGNKTMVYDFDFRRGDIVNSNRYRGLKYLGVTGGQAGSGTLVFYQEADGKARVIGFKRKGISVKKNELLILRDGIAFSFLRDRENLADLVFQEKELGE